MTDETVIPVEQMAVPKANDTVIISPRFSFKGYAFLCYLDENFGKLKILATATIGVLVLFNPAIEGFAKSGAFSALSMALSDVVLSAVQYWLKQYNKK